MGKVANLVLLQVLVIVSDCAARAAIFNNPVDRMSTGYGKRDHEQSDNNARDGMTTDLYNMIHANRGKLFNGVVGRLSTGYGKRDKDVLPQSILDLEKYFDRMEVVDERRVNLYKQKLVDILKASYQRARERNIDDTITQHNTNFLSYLDDTLALLR